MFNMNEWMTVIYSYSSPPNATDDDICFSAHGVNGHAVVLKVLCELLF